MFDLSLTHESVCVVRAVRFKNKCVARAVRFKNKYVARAVRFKNRYVARERFKVWLEQQTGETLIVDATVTVLVSLRLCGVGFPSDSDSLMVLQVLTVPI